MTGARCPFQFIEISLGMGSGFRLSDHSCAISAQQLSILDTFQYAVWLAPSVYCSQKKPASFLTGQVCQTDQTSICLTPSRIESFPEVSSAWLSLLNIPENSLDEERT